MARDSENQGTFAPLRVGVFRNIWSASVVSNFGHLMLGVAAAWQMTKLTDSEEMVALVQSALMLPLVLVSLPAGAISDMFDRRKVAVAGLAFAIASAAGLTALTVLDLLTPWLLLGFCSLIGAGVAIYSPAWQSSINEQVPREQIPAAVALGTISYNLARSVGPAIGGLLIAATGVVAAFALNAAFYFPLLLAFLLWRKPHVPSRLPPERMDRAIMGGARYAIHSPSVRNILVRTAFFGAAGATGTALAPLVARDLLGGNASVFGLMLGASGVGAVICASLVDRIRRRLTTETVLILTGLSTAFALVTIGWSNSLALTCLAMGVSGGANIIVISLLNVGVQTTVPRWVTARALSLFGSAMTFGIAIGAWVWGEVASSFGLADAFYLSAATLVASLGLRAIFPISQPEHSESETVQLDFEPDVALKITHRSGPIVIVVEYDVEPDKARAFYDVMQQLQVARKKRGAYNWSLSRDIARPERWIERYQCPTWADYLRQRERFTQADLDLHHLADSFSERSPEVRIRRYLERPFGSVRWKNDSPDPGQDDTNFLAP